MCNNYEQLKLNTLVVRMHPLRTPTNTLLPFAAGTQQSLKSNYGRLTLDKSSGAKCITQSSNLFDQLDRHLTTQPHFKSMYSQQDNQNTFNFQRSDHSYSREKIKKRLDTSIGSKKSRGNTCNPSNHLLGALIKVVKSMTKFNRERVTYLDFLEILRELYFIPQNYEPTHNDKVSQLWTMLSVGDGATSLQNLAIVLLAVTNVQIKPSLAKKYFEQLCYSLDSHRAMVSLTHKKGKIVRVLTKNSDGLFALTEQDVRVIYSYFKQMRVDRMVLRQTHQNSSRQKSYSPGAFHPQISQRSKMLAKKHKQRQKNISQCHNSQSIREDKQMSQCTFQPKTNSRQPLSSLNGINRSNILYLTGKRQMSKQKLDRNPDDIEFNKNKQAYTFRPQIIARPKVSANRPVHGQSKQVDRLVKARMEKQVKRISVQKGLPYNPKSMQKIRKQLSSRHKAQPTHITSITLQPKQPKQKPKFILQQLKFEVYLDSGQLCGCIYYNSTLDPVAVAKQFSTKHNLSQVMQDKLIDSLKQVLKQLEQGTIPGNLIRKDNNS